jgi:hypothetical protein
MTDAIAWLPMKLSDSVIKKDLPLSSTLWANGGYWH